jgi:hypothetical protein
MDNSSKLIVQKIAKVQTSAASQQNTPGNGASSLIDNRPGTVSQLKTIEPPSPTQGQSAPIQMKSKVQTTGQTFSWGPHKTIVGSHMKAWLDPNYPLKGESANINTDQNAMMTALRAHYVINGGDLVKGHLLNDNLGGKALNNNLFPITRAANKQHLVTTENYAKAQLWTHGTPIWYTVGVSGKADANQHTHQFNVALGPWDMVKGIEHPAKVQGSITSNMGDPRDNEGANAGDMDTHSVESLKSAISHGRAVHPHSAVSTMNSTEQQARDRAGSLTKTEHDNSGYTHAS